MDRKSADKSPMVLISGSCINFQKEREAIMDMIGELEWGAHYKSKTECVEDGKKTMGWDFFHIQIELDFITVLSQIHTSILKQEGSILEQQFVLWLEKQFKKRKKDYRLKLVDTPFERSKGFRLNPETFRTEDTLWDLR